MATLTQAGPETSRNTAHGRQGSTDAVAEGRIVKHRSSKACQACRSRKVRCDVTTNNACCTNCKLDGRECVLLPSRRGAPKGSSTPQSAQRVRHANTPSNGALQSTKNDSWPSHKTTTTPIVPNAVGQVPVVVTFDEDGGNDESERQPTITPVARNNTDRRTSDAYEGLLTPDIRTNTQPQHRNQAGLTPLPAFITPLSSRILDEDVEFLARKGALEVPEHESRAEILRAYLFSVHPFMPVLDAKPFVDAVLDNRGDAQVSLLLFQAVMFAGLHSLRPDEIHRLGFESAKQAREVFFDRARLLYDFNTETDSAVVLQSLVLMSSSYMQHSKWNERRHTWHWTGLAHDLARSMGLHREATTSSMSIEVRRFRRRLWWSCYIRDRMIALGTRRPMRIRDDEFDVAMLTLEDLDVEYAGRSSPAQQIMPPADVTMSNALMCIQLVELCVCIGHVVSSQYTTLGSHPEVPQTMMVMPKRDGLHSDELDACDRELDEWYRALSNNVRWASSPDTWSNAQSSSAVHWAEMDMTYLTVVNALHRARALQPPSESEEAERARKSSQSKVKDAARRLTKLGQSMLRRDQVRFLGNVGVTAFIAASLTHMLDVSSSDEDVRDASTFRLYQSIEVLQSLSLGYSSADAAVAFLASVARRAGITISLQSATSGAGVENSRAGSFAASSVAPNQLYPAHKADQWANNFRSSTRATNDLSPSGDHLQGFNARSQPFTSGNAADYAISNHTPQATGESTSVAQANLTRNSVYHFADKASAPWNSAQGEVLFDWFNGVDGGVDLGPMSFNFFNYDFYSDPAGSLGAHF